MNIIGKIAGAVADKMLNTLWPLDAHARAFMAMNRVGEKAAEDLAVAEAARDVYEPDPLADWERELQDAYLDNLTQPDDLWAAEQRHNTITDLPDDTTIDELVADDVRFNIRADIAATFTPDPLPGGAARLLPQPAQGRATGKATPTQTDIATVIAVVLRGQGINSAAIYADLAARELTHHFDIRRK